MDLLDLFASAGTAVFAASGALMGLRRGMDIVGVSFLATLTGIGGGTLRDVLLGEQIEWVDDPGAIVLCVAVSTILSLVNPRLRGRRFQWLLWADAAGLALFAVLGASKALSAEAHPIVAVLLGAMSASFGGVLRDVFCAETPVILSKEIYVTAALAGGTAFVLAAPVLGFGIAALVGFAVGLVLRVLAMRHGWSLPFPRYVPRADS
jgi:uncharacterized membrane protein YeiH